MKVLGWKKTDLLPTKYCNVNTAKKGSSIKSLGQLPRPLTLTPSNGGAPIQFQPMVMRSLSTSLNISGPLLELCGIDHLTSKGALNWRGKRIPLLNRPSLKDSAAISILETATLPPKSLKLVLGVCPDTINSTFASGTVVVEGDKLLAEETNLAPARNALCTITPEGSVYVPLINPHHYPITIKNGTFYGRAHLTKTTLLSNGIQSISMVSDSADDSGYDSEDEDTPQDIKYFENLPEDPETNPSDQYTNWSDDQKKQWFLDTYKLDTRPCFKTQHQLNLALDTLTKHFDLFSKDGSYGFSDLITHRIITDDVQPVKDKLRPCNPLLQDSLKAQLEKWDKHGVIEPSYSPWAANVVPVKKKDNSIRWCIDYRKLNAVTKKDSFPMPSVSETFNALAGSCLFSSVDMEGAFHSVAIHPADREKTAFITPFGTFQMKKLGFGVSNGPATYCRLIQMVLRGIPSSIALGFLDDGIIHSNDVETHCQNLDRVFTAYANAGLKINPKKCSLFMEEINYLGHTINQHGVRPPAEYIDQIKTWPVPDSPKKIRRFLGMVGYYRNHIPDYALLSAPWTDALKKDNVKKKIKPTPEMIANFDKLKEKLTTAPILGFPYFHGPKAGTFILDTDFSCKQISGILSQIQDGQEVVIAYGSKKLDSGQQNYPSTKGELFAGKHFMQKYAFYLKWCQQFTWRTDNSALQWLNSMQDPPSIIYRWREVLRDFNFKVVHRAGTKHTNADCLSRVEFDQPPPKKPKLETEDQNTLPEDHKTLPEDNNSLPEDHNPLPEDATVAALASDADSLSYKPQEPTWQDLLQPTAPPPPNQLMKRITDLIPVSMEDEQQKCSTLSMVRKWIRGIDKPDRLMQRCLTPNQKKYLGTLSSLKLIQRGKEHVLCSLYLKDDGTVPHYQICLPEHLWVPVIQAAHTLNGHMSHQSTLDRLKTLVHFPNMSKMVKQVIHSCQPCITKHKTTKPQKHTLISSMPPYPFHTIHVDFVGPIYKSSQGNQYIFTVKDAFSRWVEAFPMKEATANNAAFCLETQIFPRFGLPQRIHSDCGSQFTSNFWKQLGEQLNIKISYTTPYHPQSNGMVERFHRDLGKMLAATNKGGSEDWEQGLPAALMALRSAKSRTTNLSPYSILFGREMSLPLDLIFALPDKDTEHITDAKARAFTIRKRINRAYECAIIHAHRAVERQRRSYHQDKQYFTVGQKVWLYTPKTFDRGPTKLKTRWSGPWTVCAPPGNEIMIRISPMAGWQFKHSIVVAIDRLKLYTGENPIEPDPSSDLQMTGDEFAEELDPAEFEWNNDHSVDLETYKHLMPVLTGPSPYPDDTLDDGDQARHDTPPQHSDIQTNISQTNTSPTQTQVQCPDKAVTPNQPVLTSVTYPIVSVQLFPPIISNLKYKPKIPPTSSRKK